MKLDMTLSMTDSASAEDWVKKNRIQENQKKKKEKEIAEEKMRRLIEEEEEMVQQSRPAYSSTDLKGLKVMHSDRDFTVGEETILTLKDSNILETDEEGRLIGINEEEDVLENVGIAESDRKIERENREKRNKRPIYSGLDDYEFGEDVLPGTKAPLLPQYEKEKKQKAKLQIGSDGLVEVTGGSSAMGESGSVLGKRRVETLLDTKKSEMQSFYTAKEFAKFSKLKKSGKSSRKTRKKEEVEDEDEDGGGGGGDLYSLLDNPPEEGADAAAAECSTNGSNAGSDDAIKNGASGSTGKKITVDVENNRASAVGAAGRPGAATSKGKVRIPRIVEIDDEDPEMVLALAKARRLAMQQRKGAAGDNEEGDTPGEGTAGAGCMSDRGAHAALAYIQRARAGYLSGYAESKTSYDDGSIPMDMVGRGPAAGSGSVTEKLEEEEDDLDVDGRRPDGTLVFNRTTEFGTRLHALLNENARSRAEQALKASERAASMMSMSSANGLGGSAGVGGGGGGDGSGGRIEGEDEWDGDMYGEDDVQLSGFKSASAQGSSSGFGLLGAAWGRGARSNGEGDGEKEDDDLPPDDEQLEFLHKQPTVATGIAATLALLKSTGDLKRSENLAGRAKDRRELDPSAGDFDVKLEYRDKLGRKLTQKEAFRQLSYKFHGYGPGKKKQEKRQKAMEMQSKAQVIANDANNMVGTMSSLTKAQEATGKAHITIQGGVSSSAANTANLAAIVAKKVAKKKEKERAKEKES